MTAFFLAVLSNLSLHCIGQDGTGNSNQPIDKSSNDASVNDSRSSDIDKLEGFEGAFPAMGATFSLNVYSSDERIVKTAFNDVQMEVDRLVKVLSDYDPQSELNLFHAKQPNTSVKLSPDLLNVFAASQNWNRDTQGAFDAAIGSLTRLWRNHRRRSSVPTEKEIIESRAHAGWSHVKLDVSDGHASLDDSQTRIDFGGIAAGYIVDRAFEVLLKHDLDRCLINCSGDIRCGAPPPGRDGWRIEVAALSKGGQPLRRILIANTSITTSGDLWQFTLLDGVRRSHILNPKTGYGIAGPAMTVVIAPTCIEADAAATAFSVMDFQDAMKMIESRQGYAAMMASQPKAEQPLRYVVTERFPPGIAIDMTR